MFEKASRLKMRFPTSQGSIAVEDLWDIPLTSTTGKANLNDIAKGLNKVLKSDEEDFVTVNRKSNSREQLAFDIVKHIITLRIAENEATATAAANRKKKQDILALIANKENEQLAGSSLEDLRKLADSL
jgi:hypothetical protein